MVPTRQLFYVSVTIDVVAILLSFFISAYFAMGIFLYIAASRAYSYRGIRLKKYPLVGYLTVIFFQGAVTYFLVKHGASLSETLHVSGLAMAAASLLVGGFYPLTQIYQHKQDKEDGVRTLSILLGYRGTFIFTELDKFFIFQTFMLPVLVYFFWWFYKVYKDVAQANFTNTMRMNLLASVCTNAAFITILISYKF
jgi:1,4-dihydroxy-2-naphthoate octaprenyltransferase